MSPACFLPRSGIAQCSGALIGMQRQHVLTAGHCLVDSSQSTGNVDKITFYPGLKGSDLPFGTLTAVKVGVATFRVQAVFLQLAFSRVPTCPSARSPPSRWARFVHQSPGCRRRVPQSVRQQLHGAPPLRAVTPMHAKPLCTGTLNPKP